MQNQLTIIQRAIEHGSRAAVDANGTVTNYQSLVEKSQSLAASLLDGLQDLNEARVAFLIPPGERYIQSQWGVWQAGGIAVPLSLSATEKELEYALTDSKSSTVIATKDLSEKVVSICRRNGIRFLPFENLPTNQVVSLPEISRERRAMILYTSGTTNKPKGVVSTHANIEAQIKALIEAWQWQRDDRIPLFLPLHHIHGIINVMSCALWMGAKIEAFPRFTLDPILDRVANHAFSVFMAVPTIYVKLIESLEKMSPSQRTSIVQGFAGMRLMISGSAALPASVHEKWTELTGQKLLERYGMTEIGMALSNPFEGERRPGAVGQSLPGVEIRLQSESGDVVKEDDVPGEIQVRGPNVFREYWNRPEATNDAFEEGWFKTGDMAVIEDNYYRIMGRTSVDIIKSGGYKLSALEIEASLLDHPSITECAIVGIPDDTWGEIVAAAIVTKSNGSGQMLDLNSLRAWCKDRISKYKIPQRLLTVEKLPRNAMGKVTKPAVTKLFTETK